MIVELKCCKCLLPENRAQTIHYLAAAKLPVGLLVNFGHRELEYKRIGIQENWNTRELEHKRVYRSLDPAAEGDPASAADPVFESS